MRSIGYVPQRAGRGSRSPPDRFAVDLPFSRGGEESSRQGSRSRSDPELCRSCAVDPVEFRPMPQAAHKSDPVTPVVMLFADHGVVPNNPTLPLLVYRRAIDVSGQKDPAAL